MQEYAIFFISSWVNIYARPIFFASHTGGACIGFFTFNLVTAASKKAHSVFVSMRNELSPMIDVHKKPVATDLSGEILRVIELLLSRS